LALVSVGVNLWDTGPYGHADLYGNAEEWVRTTIIENQGNLCTLPDYSPDPLSFAPEQPQQLPQYVRHLGELLLQPGAKYHVLDIENRIWFPYWVRTADTLTSYCGFRCAFPMP
jgi:hypothetical protein